MDVKLHNGCEDPSCLIHIVYWELRVNVQVLSVIINFSLGHLKFCRQQLKFYHPDTLVMENILINQGYIKI